MKNSMLEEKLKEIRELREQLDKSPIRVESPFKAIGLRVVATPTKGDTSTREYNQRQKRRAVKAEYKLQTTLAGKLQGYKVA